ncbi:MAG: hypothetical protein AB7G93_15370 [Bdellovibrionales bacterium]
MSSSITFDLDYLTRPHHFEGQLVRDVHLLTEQDYLDFLRTVTLYYLHQVPGILHGLDVERADNTKFTVSAGIGHYKSTDGAFSKMKEVCLIKPVTVRLKEDLEVTSGGSYQLIAKTVPDHRLKDTEFDEYHYKTQKVKFEAIAQGTPVIEALFLKNFTYDGQTLTASPGPEKLSKTVRKINGLTADANGEVTFDGDKLIQIINTTGTTLIQENRTAAVTHDELVSAIADLKAELTERINVLQTKFVDLDTKFTDLNTKFTALDTLVKGFQSQIDELRRRIPRFKRG